MVKDETLKKGKKPKQQTPKKPTVMYHITEKHHKMKGMAFVATKTSGETALSGSFSSFPCAAGQ